MTRDELFQKIALQVGRTCIEKNVAYGDSFSKAGAVLAILYPNGIKPSDYGRALAITRIIDKLFRIANQPRAFGESPGLDIAGYGVLMAADDATMTEESGPTSLPSPPGVPCIEMPAETEPEVFNPPTRPDKDRRYQVYASINAGPREACRIFEDSVSAIQYYDSFYAACYRRGCTVHVHLIDPKGNEMLTKAFEGNQ